LLRRGPGRTGSLSTRARIPPGGRLMMLLYSE
jgi:hypothetical protein